MAHYHATVESRRPAGETFEYLATFSNAAEWDPGVLAARQLDPGPVGAGTRFRLEVPLLGRRTSLTYEVTRHVPGRQVVLAAATGLLRATDRIEVSATPAGARVSYDADVRLRGPLALLDPVLSRGFHAVAERAAAGLTRTLSTAAPAAGPVPPAGAS